MGPFLSSSQYNIIQINKICNKYILLIQRPLLIDKTLLRCDFRQDKDTTEKLIKQIVKQGMCCYALLERIRQVQRKM